jgi:hypothetical protein
VSSEWKRTHCLILQSTPHEITAFESGLNTTKFAPPICRSKHCIDSVSGNLDVSKQTSRKWQA